MKDPLFRKLFWLLIAIAILHITALELEFYWTLWWYDVMMHFLGGLWIGLVGLWGWKHSVYMKRIFGNRNPVVMVMACAICVGVLWEVYEYLTGQTYVVFMSYPLDTAKDLCMDTLGGLAAGFYGSKTVFSKRLNEHEAQS